MKLLLTILLFAYNAFVLGGTAYLIEVHHWSPWWFALSLLVLMSIDLREK